MTTKLLEIPNFFEAEATFIVVVIISTCVVLAQHSDDNECNRMETGMLETRDPGVSSKCLQ